MDNTTIAAIATAATNAGIGIVRISGPDAFSIIDRIYLGKKSKKISLQESHSVHYGFITDAEEVIDEVLVLLLRGPRSFTGEDTVEIDCHGGAFVMKRILSAVLSAGAVLAEPGEFTKRAFLNGRLDLSQAEAVMDVVASRNKFALKNSISQLKGSLRNKIIDMRAKILYHTAYIEAALDDPEHMSLEGYQEELHGVTRGLLEELDRLISSASEGRVIKEGIRTVILGKPNAGKSSFLNALLGTERAIVTDIPGTTRDVLEEQLQWNGLSLHLVDTAGIRETPDPIEKMGGERALASADDADLLLYMVDGSVPLDAQDEMIIERLQGRRAVVLLNKSDLKTVVSKEVLLERIEAPVVEISAKEERGLSQVQNLIWDMFLQNKLDSNEDITITNLRHLEALEAAKKSLLLVIESLALELPEDFYSIDLLDAYKALGKIIGETVGEDLIHEIFEQFCMGK